MFAVKLNQLVAQAQTCEASVIVGAKFDAPTETEYVEVVVAHLDQEVLASERFFASHAVAKLAANALGCAFVAA